MPKQNTLDQEEWSAFADDAISRADAQVALSRLLDSDEGRAQWERYHLIGDIIRSDALAPRGSEWGLADRVMNVLAQDTLALTDTGDTGMPLPPEHMPGRAGANAPHYRRKALAGALVIGFFTVLLYGQSAHKQDVSTAPLASAIEQQTASVPAADLAMQDERPVMTRDAELDELLSAHQQMGGHSALQNPSGFLRNATFDRSRR